MESLDFITSIYFVVKFIERQLRVFQQCETLYDAYEWIS